MCQVYSSSTAHQTAVVFYYDHIGWLLKLFQMRFFHFFVSRSVPDRFQIVPRLGGPLFQISRFLDFQKNLEQGTGTPFQILARISRFPDCSRFWNRIPTWLRQLLSERAEDAGDKKEKDSYFSLHCCCCTRSHRRSQQSPPPSPHPSSSS